MAHFPHLFREGDLAALRTFARFLDIGHEMGASRFLKVCHGRKAGIPPRLDVERELGMPSGNIFHGDLHVSQLFSMRPVPRWSARRRTS